MRGMRGIGAALLLAPLLSACLGGGLRPAISPPGPVAAPLPPRPAVEGPHDPSVSDDDLDALWQRQLRIPVEGVSRQALRDTYRAPRGDRLHLALDIMAPRETPVVAADDHVIGRLGRNALGGNVIYATDPAGRFVYYYAHLERWQRGLAVGDTVARGTRIGYVGTTGNAPRDAPHLHFQVMKRGAGRAWWDGPPINPFTLFAPEGGTSGSPP